MHVARAKLKIRFPPLNLQLFDWAGQFAREGRPFRHRWNEWWTENSTHFMFHHANVFGLVDQLWWSPAIGNRMAHHTISSDIPRLSQTSLPGSSWISTLCFMRCSHPDLWSIPFKYRTFNVKPFCSFTDSGSYFEGTESNCSDLWELKRGIWVRWSCGCSLEFQFPFWLFL
jgi:hypothetical protein